MSHKKQISSMRGARRGQALLMAVLVMVFIALLGTTFITVVAMNIGQTERHEERDKARSAAQAGILFANKQLVGSSWGWAWRPDIPAYGGITPAVSTDLTYWTPFETAQGWASDGHFIKYPDPRAVNQNLSTANYMLKVEKVAAGDADNQDADKTGMLRLTAIGFSPDDQSTFQSIVAYKDGSAQQPTNSQQRTINNFDWKNGVVPSAKASTYTTGSSITLDVTDASGDFPSSPFYIVVGDATTGTTLSGQAVASATQDASDPTKWTLALAGALPGGAPSAGARVEVAAAIGVNDTLDFNNDGTPLPISYGVNTSSTNPFGTRVNGSALFFGSVNPQNLSYGGGSVKASGLILNYAGGGFTTTVSLNSSSTSAGNLTGNFSGSSTDAGYPGFTTSSAPALAKAYEIWNDGFNRIKGNTDETRQEKSYVPPDITSGGDEFGRYRQLSKYSTMSDASLPEKGAYGYGENSGGIYINNWQDKEKVGVTGSPNVYKEMTQAELRNLWFSDKTTNVYNRKGAPADYDTNDKSLEEQHLRGWVGPDEFRPRGVLLELNNDGTLNITLDPRDDGRDPGSSNILHPNEGPSPYKAWHNPDGTLAGYDDGDSLIENHEGGVYTRTGVAWPANGVFFAEGNVRIKGSATNAPRSLTVVSMNNIYIEDSLDAGTNHRVMLLAKKNVVVNPTRVIGRPDGQTLLSSATTAGDVNIDVEDAYEFRRGDWINIGTDTDPYRIVSVAGNTITVDTPGVPAHSAYDVVRTVSDPLNNKKPYVNYADRLSDFTQALLRRVSLPAGSTTARFGIRHSAELYDAPTNNGAIKITTEQSTAITPPAHIDVTEAKLSNKLVNSALPRSSIILSTEKHLTVDYDETPGGPGNERFPAADPTTEALAQAYRVAEATDSDTSNSDDDLLEDLNKRHTSTPERWNYKATIQNSYDTNTAPMLIPPSYFLAAVGNRYPFGSNPAGSYPWKENVLGTTEDYEVPMATNVVPYMNSAPATMTNDRYDDRYGTGPALEQVKQFGFNFINGLGTNGTNTVDNAEDVLTVDRTFYNNGHKSDTSAGDNTYYTLDSRVMDNAQGGENELAFRFDIRAKDYFNNAGTPRIPFYRLSRLKLENNSQLNGNYEFENLSPGYTFNINAYVYAQEGSWFVIPGDYYDASSNVDDTATTTPADVRQTYVNLPHNTSTAKDADENLDLDRDGTPSRGEQAATYRFHRYNYQINFSGAITENQTASVITVNSTGNPVYGEVQNWTDKWATTTITSANFTGNTATDTLDYTTLSTTNNFKTITYDFDPYAAAGSLESDVGFRTPVSPDIVYESG